MWILLAFYFINLFVRGIGFLLIYSWLQASSIMIWVVTLANGIGHPPKGQHRWRWEYRAQSKITDSAEQEHSLGQRWETLLAWLGAEQQDLYGGSLDDHASLSWRARETGNESTVEVDVTNGAGEAGCRTTKTARREERRDYAQSQRGIASHVCYS